MMLKDFENIIKDTKKRIEEIDPFLGRLINHIDVKIKFGDRQCYTYGKDINIGEGYFKMYNEDDLLFAVMHELLHIVLLQPSRMNGMDALRYNVLTDIIVNDVLLSYGVSAGNNQCYTAEQYNIHNLRDLPMREIEEKLSHINTPTGISPALLEKMCYYEKDSETFIKGMIGQITSNNPLLQSKLEHLYL